MDALFLLNEADRSSFLRLLIQSFNCTYICLWSYVPHPSNCLIFFDGCYKEENNNQPSSSSGSRSTLPLNLFFEYQNTIFLLENDIQVPGFAFRNNMPYLEIRDVDLVRLAFNQTQRRFYQEAGIKKAVFMGCRAGEIELGLSNEIEINMEMGMREFFPEDFSRQSPPPPPLGDIPHQLQPSRPPPADPTSMASTSSSSLRSLSTGSPDSSLIFNIPSTSTVAAEISGSTTTTTVAPAAVDPMQLFSDIRLPMLETEHNTMTQAFLAVLTSPSSTSSTSTSHSRPQQNPPYNYQLNPKSSAFKRYASSPRPPLPPSSPQIRSGVRKPTLLNRAFLYYRNLHIARRHSEFMLGSGGAGGSRPSTTQLHHMMSERKRREKLNESFQTLKSLLPPGTKRDKASVLAKTREYLTTLKEQVAELSRRNQQLEAQLLPYKVVAAEEMAGISSNERSNVRISPVAESPSEGRIVDLRISVRGECLATDLMIRLLEFLKQDRNVSVMSMEANTIDVEAGPLNFINFRLRLEGNGWDESAFMEAVRRLVADLAR